MEKVKKTNIITLQKADKEKNKNRQFIITVRKKGSGFDARMTLKVVGGGKNPRITAYGYTEDEAVYRLLIKVKEKLIEYKKMGLLIKNISLKIYDSIIESMNILQIKDSRILQEIPNVLQILTKDTIPEELIYGIQIGNTPLFSTNNLNNAIESKDFKTVALEWFKYKLSFTVASKDNPNPLSPKTLKGYNETIMHKLIPHFKNNKNIETITENDIKECIMKPTGYRSQESIYVVAKMVFDFARKNGYIMIMPYIKKPQKPKRSKENKTNKRCKNHDEGIIFIETDRQETWIKAFEEEDTDVTLLFETMLLSSARPEEACRIEMDCISRRN